jgi:hypothetical protein
VGRTWWGTVHIIVAKKQRERENVYNCELSPLGLLFQEDLQSIRLHSVQGLPPWVCLFGTILTDPTRGVLYLSPRHFSKAQDTKKHEQMRLYQTKKFLHSRINHQNKETTYRMGG